MPELVLSASRALQSSTTVRRPDHWAYSRYVSVGLFYLRQLFFANFDLKMHDKNLDTNTDYTKLWNELREKISLVQGGEYKPWQGTFGHIVGGYDAGYYGWVLVFCSPLPG